VDAALVEPGMTAIKARITSHQHLPRGMIVVYQSYWLGWWRHAGLVEEIYCPELLAWWEITWRYG